MKFNDSIQYVKGIGEKRARLFNKLDIFNVSDLLNYYPRDYEDRSQIKDIDDLIDGETVCIKGTVAQLKRTFKAKNGAKITQAVVSDGKSLITVTWFNSPFVENTLSKGGEFTFFGKVQYKGMFPEMVNPVIDRNNAGKTGKIVPVYPLTANLTQQNLRNAVEFAMNNLEEEFVEILPPEILKKFGLISIGEAISQIHFPKDFESFIKARKRLVFQELFIMQMGIFLLKNTKNNYPAEGFSDIHSVRDFVSGLPYELTNAQKKVINEILNDLKKDVPMNRLVQGDVGSGKTVVAAAAMFSAVKSGFQAAFMAPTEILAKQHYENLVKLFEPWGMTVACLTGGPKTKGKAETLKRIASGEIDIVVGTHALIGDDVQFKNLGLAVTDEQHRFGVRQRASLNEKGKKAHTLVMTAPPIPRTLSLILYGDLDVSVIDELPPGRQPIQTFAVGENYRPRIFDFIKKNIQKGRQAYIVCPLVEESDLLSAKSVIEYAENVSKKELKGFSVDVLYGSMKQKEKDAVMERFKAGEIQVLISTTVIEVGVDVPNASVMVIENAERFGLSQLHQLRGRIGRGPFESFCVLVCTTNGEIARERMKVMCDTNDGFVISEKDLKLRGPGEFFGVRQHGLPELKIADLAGDIDIMSLAQSAAKEIISADANLSMPQNRPLRNHLINKFNDVGGKNILN